MKQLLAIILIAVIACTTTEEEKKNPIETIKEDVTEKAKEIAEKAKKIAEEIAGKAKKMAQEIAEKAKEMGDESSEKAKEIAEEVAAKAQDIAKDFMKFFEKLSEEVKMAIVWLKENGYWDDLVNLAETNLIRDKMDYSDAAGKRQPILRHHPFIHRKRFSNRLLYINFSLSGRMTKGGNGETMHPQLRFRIRNDSMPS